MNDAYLDDERRNPHDSQDNSPPEIPGDTPLRNAGCPQCQSLRIESLDYARKAGGAVGTAAGTTSAFALALSGAEVGATFGLTAGPMGAAFGGIAGAVVAGLLGGAAGCAAGAALGEMLDEKVFDNYRCTACGHTFSRKSS